MSAMPVSYVLQVPTPAPNPVPDCTVCAVLAKRRAHAQAAGDYSRASDCNVRLRRHDQHPPIPH